MPVGRTLMRRGSRPPSVGVVPGIVVQLVSDARARIDAANQRLALPGSTTFDFKRDTIEQPYAVQANSDFSYIRFEVRPGDGSSGSPGSGTNRAELVADWSSGDTHNCVPFGTKIWQSFSQRINGTLDTSAGNFVVANQWHAAQDPTDASLSPPLSWAFSGTSFRIATLWDDQVTQTAQTNTHFQGRYYSDPLPVGAWNNWVLAAVFDYNNPGTGSLEVWRNGTKVINLTGISMGFNDPRGPRPQFGIYTNAAYANALVAEYANMEISYTSLLDRVTSPLPLPAGVT